MKHIGWITIVLVYFFGSLQGSAQVTAPEKKQLKFGTLTDSKFFEIVEKVLKKAYGKIGYEVSYEKFPALRSLEKTNNGDFDGEAFRVDAIAKNYPNLIRIPVIVFKAEVFAFAKKEINLDNGLEGLKKYKIAIRRGVKYIEDKTEGFDVFTVNSNEAMFQVLANDRVDLVLAPRRIDKASMALKEKAGIRMMEKSVFSIDLYHYLHKKNEAIAPLITQSLEEMDKSGELVEIANKAVKEISGDK